MWNRVLLMSDKLRVLFICTHNSARSQMAEGLRRHIAGDRYEVASAGTEKSVVRPDAITVMAEVGVDISGSESKTLERYLDDRWDYVITVCDDANESCPVFPGAANRSHWSFRDPSKFQGTDEERLEFYRRIRNEIAARVRLFVNATQPSPAASLTAG
jgi:arsenate reductase